ncbi:MAG: hypothetical protein HUJ98_13835 [Bacteroidaceae bacterium]|nr:hypothetical protein [Bacteroidaceae bacterium]
MNKRSDFLTQEASRKAAKVATDSLWAQENGTKAYRLAGLIFIGCGVMWGIISLIPIMVGEPVNKCMWMWIVAAVQIVIGVVLVALCNKAKAFQKWANRNFEKDKSKYLN